MHVVLSSATLFGPANPTGMLSVTFAFIMDFLAGRDSDRQGAAYDPVSLVEGHLTLAKSFSSRSDYLRLQTQLCSMPNFTAAQALLHQTLQLGTLSSFQMERLALMTEAVIQQRLAKLREELQIRSGEVAAVQLLVRS